jgi:uncharacterized peroxidase-related enzyme
MLRLAILERGHSWPKRLLLGAIERIGRVRADDVFRTSIYRPRFFGHAWMRFAQSILRGPSPWSAGERELIAAMVSRLNACPFCVGIHTGTATLGLTRPVDIAMLDNWRGANLDPRMAAVFELLEKRAADPDSLVPDDIDNVRLAGVSDDAISDVFCLAFMFDVINRLANTFGFSTETEEGTRKSAAMLHRLGYRVPGILLR